MPAIATVMLRNPRRALPLSLLRRSPITPSRSSCLRVRRSDDLSPATTRRGLRQCLGDASPPVTSQRCWGSLEAARCLMYSPGRYKDSPSRIPPFGVPSRGGPGGGPGGAPGGPPGGPPRGAPRAPGGPRARKFPEIPPGPPGPPGGPRRGHFGGFSGLLHRALDRIWGVSRGGRFPAQFVPKMAKKKFNLSRLGELLNTLRNVHPRPPGGVPGGPPGGAPRGPPGGGSWGWVSGGVQGPPDMTPLDIPPEDNPRI